MAIAAGHLLPLVRCVRVLFYMVSGQGEYLIGDEESQPPFPSGEIDPLNHEEIALFLKTCARYYPEHYSFFLTAFRTGMRLGEFLALQWRDVDWHDKFFLVRRSYKRGRLDHTKTGKQRRVDMSNQLIENLKDFYRFRRKEALEGGTGKVEEFIFHRGGKPIEQNSIRYPFKRILEKAELREIRFHDIRHTYASLLLTDGATPVYVKEQMEHSSIQITVDIYGHLPIATGIW